MTKVSTESEARTTYKQLSEASRVETVRKAADMVLSGSSQYQAVKKYGVPRSTLRDFLKRDKPSIKNTRYFTAEEEVLLVQQLAELQKKGKPIPKLLIMSVAEQLYKRKEGNNSGRVPGEKWYRNFMKRNKHLKVREEEISGALVRDDDRYFYSLELSLDKKLALKRNLEIFEKMDVEVIQREGLKYIKTLTEDIISSEYGVNRHVKKRRIDDVAKSDSDSNSNSDNGLDDDNINEEEESNSTDNNELVE